MSGYSDIQVPERTIRLGMMLGLMKYDAKENVHVLTDKGEEWLRTYCEEKLAEAEAQS
jgi:hypothetical protein